MKKFIIMLCTIAVVAGAGNAFAWPASNGGAQGFPTFGQFGGAALFTTDFAPESVTVIDLGTKGGYYNIRVDGLTKYQFMTVKASDNTAVLCSAKFGGYSTGAYDTTSTNAYTTSGNGPWHPGNGMQALGIFGCASSTYAARTKLVVLKQK